MIFEQIFSFFANTVSNLVSSVNIGNISTDLMTKFYSVIDYLFENLSLLGLFIRPRSMVVVSLLMIAILNFERIYLTAIWIKKLIKP